jgi:hypothetical protein
MSAILKDGSLVEVTGPADWAHDLVEAAEQLGYGVTLIRPSEVELVNKSVRITIESYLLTGRLLREVLAEKK